MNLKSIYIIAGEASGDMIGAGLMSEISSKRAIFSGVGGSKMQERGLTSLFPIENISLMGFVEVLPHIFRLKRIIRQTANDIIAKKPDILVTIDSPGFCYRVVTLVQKLRPNMKIIHIVAPSVWAYKPGRAAKFAAIYDHMLTLLPFEPPFFEREGLSSTFIGHPIFEQEFGGAEGFKKNHNIKENEKVIVVTPGSRKGEITRHLPEFVSALISLCKANQNLVICFVLSGYEDLVRSYLQEVSFKYLIVLEKEKLAAYSAAHLALAKSGTNTLEIAASGAPMIVAYKLNTLTYFFIKLMAKIKYASLINIIADREIIPEFLQSACKAKNIYLKLQEMLDNPEICAKQVRDSKKVLEDMQSSANTSPIKEAARVILELT